MIRPRYSFVIMEELILKMKNFSNFLRMTHSKMKNSCNFLRMTHSKNENSVNFLRMSHSSNEKFY